MDKALKHLEAAEKIVPDDPIVLEHLGQALLKKGNRARALELFQKSLTLESNERSEDQKRALEDKVKQMLKEEKSN